MLRNFMPINEKLNILIMTLVIIQFYTNTVKVDFVAVVVEKYNLLDNLGYELIALLLQTMVEYCVIDWKQDLRTEQFLCYLFQLSV